MDILHISSTDMITDEMQIRNTIKYTTELPYIFNTKYGDKNAGIDLLANIDKSITLSPNGRILIPSGLKIELPNNMMGMVVGRSGLALKFGIIVPNSPGIIDSDYRGEVGVILYNISNKTYTINPLDKIAQLIILSIETQRLNWIQTDGLSESERAENGFGSTGAS